MRRLIAPARALVAAVLFGLAVAAGLIVIAASQPWMGLRLAYDAEAGGAVVRHAKGSAAAIPVGTVLTGISGERDRLYFEADDFVYEPDGSLGTFANYAEFLDRQGRLAAIQASPMVSLHDDAGRTWRVAPRPSRPLTDLPPDFWVQLLVGVVAWVIAAAIWAFRPGETSTRYLLLSGFATLVFAPFAGVYSTRELSLPRTLFQWLNDGNFLGGSLFAAALAALLLYYPRRMAPRWVGLVIVGIFLAWFVAQQAGAFQDMTMARRLLVLIALGGTFALAGVHWWLSRRDPIARAALQWFLLSWVICTSIFGLGVLLPQLFGVDTSALQGSGFLVFLVVYVGLAFGVLRFRLFELGRWWGRVVAWAASLMLLVLLDLGFLLGLQLSSELSLSLALLVTGIVWLPLRAWVWGRVFPRRPGSQRAVFQTVTGIGLTPAADEQARRWREQLQGLFEALEAAPAEPVASAAIERDGLELAVPGPPGMPGVRLSYAGGGRRLFGPADVALANELTEMLRHVIAGRAAFETGVIAERRRIARDMHDNLGAQLLNALHAREGERKDLLIREALADLRGIINDAAEPGSLEEALADLRHETAERLAACHVGLEWPLAEGEAIHPPAGLVHALRSILREAVSNVVKHARAKRVQVLIQRQDGTLTLVIEDDGGGFDSASAATGKGLANIRSRAAAQGGRVEVGRGEAGGTRLLVELPLAEAAAVA